MSNTKFLVRRLLACIYEVLILIALWMFATWLFMQMFGDATHQPNRFGLQIFLWTVSGAYFVSCWIKSGQTIAAQAWKIQVLDKHHQPLTFSLACMRYALASLFLLSLGIGFWWALFDKDHQFLHDRLLGTQLILR